MRWAREHARPTRPTGGRGRGPRGGRWRAALRGCGEMGKGACVCVCVCERVRKGFCGPSKECVFGKGTCSLSDTEGKAKVFAFALTERRILGGGGALQRGQTALWETRSESHDAREVHHLYVSIAVRRLADGHFATLISHLGSDLEGRALYLALIDVTRLVNQVVASKTVWEQEHEGEL